MAGTTASWTLRNDWLWPVGSTDTVASLLSCLDRPLGGVSEYDLGICKYDASVDRCACPKYQCELGLTLWPMTQSAAHSVFASPMALLLPGAVCWQLPQMRCRR